MERGSLIYRDTGYTGLSNPYSAEIFLCKPWRPKGFFQFEIIINVLVSSFCFIYIPMLRVYGYYYCLILLVQGPSLDVKI